MKVSKRNNLKIGIYTGTALIVSKWQKPIINTIMLPSHAQTSRGSAPIILVEASNIASPIVVTIEDDKSNFDYTIETLIISDFVSINNDPPQANVVNGEYSPPLLNDSFSGNSETKTIITTSINRTPQSEIEVRIHVTDSDDQTTVQISRISTP